MRGPDAVLLRAPRGGGRMTAVLYPRVDSVVWRSGEAAPALGGVLDFDTESGVLAVIDTAGVPVRIDLRLGTVRRASKSPLSVAAAAGGTFYGVDSSGAVIRLTAAGGTWRVRLVPTPQALLPQRDGTVLAAASRGGTGVLWVLRPPSAAATDSVRVPGGAQPVRLTGADRVYFAAGDELLAVQTRTLAPAAPIVLGAAMRAAAASPSGDRLYVLTERRGELQVADRYGGTITATVTLPGAAREIRVDPLGRYLLVRPERGDSAWVVAAGTERLVGAVPGAWRADLPIVLPDGAILTASGADVAVVDPATLRTRTTIAGGAGDYWHLVTWNGFRPRAAGLDQPAPVRSAAAAAPPAEAPAESTDVADDSLAAPADSAPSAPEQGEARPPRPTVPPADGAPAGATRTGAGSLAREAAAGEVALAARPETQAGRGGQRGGRGFTVQFAAAPTEREARRTLVRLRVTDGSLRVVPRTFDGRTVYRVVAGPFPTRAEAVRVGQVAGAGNYWIYGGAP
jgi:cell division septation protein DedD